MNRKGLYFLIALALGGVGAVQAQDAPAASTASSDSSMSSFDGRWYIAPTVGGFFNDQARNTNSRQIYYGLGFGKFVSSNVSIDAFVDRTRRDRDNGAAAGGGHSNRSWTSTAIGASARFYAGDWNAWRPYGMVGLMGSEHQSSAASGWSPAAQVGVGVSKMVSDRTNIRVEAGYRYDWDNKTQSNKSAYGDTFLGLTLVSRFGAAPVAAAPAPVAAPVAPVDCSTMDSDNDGVNDCEDKCPATAAGTIVGPDGCPQKVVIDLRGVNFKFDRPRKGETDISKSLAEPTADSIAVLNQAVDTLQRYPQVHVTVAGYTDSKGTDEYNQKLSERRASIVYNFLTSHGIDASRLEGPIGHGESNPIGDNATDAGRAQNRRTELQVQQ
ncbi:MAG: OmpA family protein [Rhodanobacter sp.]|jgi:OOP family OmpA-OmpF porin|nr:OmpA family protein [Rhodanobacter sp.]